MTEFGRKKPAAAKGLRADEMKICGVSACRAVFDRRREEIIRAYVTEPRVKAFGVLLRWCANQRRAYHVIPEAEMEKVTQSTHHEGVCLLVKKRAEPVFAEFCRREGAVKAPRCVLLLEGVSNPHNIGAIVRVAAHFGAAAVVLAGGDAVDDGLALPAAVHRTAEGGLESVPVMAVADGVRAVRELRHAGFTIVGTSSHVRDSLYGAPLPLKTVLLLGSEADGLSAALAREASRNVAIPGTGAVESLNVACAAAVILGEFWRTHTAR
jgi:TrmH RNA methyltransferase